LTHRVRPELAIGPATRQSDGRDRASMRAFFAITFTMLRYAAVALRDLIGGIDRTIQQTSALDTGSRSRLLWSAQPGDGTGTI